MNKTMILASATALALTAGSANLGARAKAPNTHRLVRPAEVLYNQNNPDVQFHVESENFTSGVHTSLDDAAADDFVVPAGKKWTITEVDVSGEYGGSSCTSGCATSEIVTFYKNKHRHPGAIAGRGADTFTLNCTDNSGSFACSIPNGVKLTGGRSGRTYWVSVVANMDEHDRGDWLWYQPDANSNNPGKWQNPANGWNTGCTTWNNTSTCIGSGRPDDWAFELIGSQR